MKNDVLLQMSQQRLFNAVILGGTSTNRTTKPTGGAKTAQKQHFVINSDKLHHNSLLFLHHDYYFKGRFTQKKNPFILSHGKAGNFLFFW